MSNQFCTCVCLEFCFVLRNMLIEVVDWSLHLYGHRTTTTTFITTNLCNDIAVKIGRIHIFRYKYIYLHVELCDFLPNENITNKNPKQRRTQRTNVHVSVCNCISGRETKKKGGRERRQRIGLGGDREVCVGTKARRVLPLSTLTSTSTHTPGQKRRERRKEEKGKGL